MGCKICERTRAAVSSVPAAVRRGALSLADLVRLKRDQTGSKQRHGPPVSRHSPEGFDEILSASEDEDEA